QFNINKFNLYNNISNKSNIINLSPIQSNTLKNNLNKNESLDMISRLATGELEHGLTLLQWDQNENLNLINDNNNNMDNKNEIEWIPENCLNILTFCMKHNLENNNNNNNNNNN